MDSKLLTGRLGIVGGLGGKPRHFGNSSGRIPEGGLGGAFCTSIAEAARPSVLLPTWVGWGRAKEQTRWCSRGPVLMLVLRRVLLHGLPLPTRARLPPQAPYQITSNRAENQIILSCYTA